MCGIVGYTRDPTRPIESDARLVRAMLEPIAHRGPDAAEVYVNGPIAFGHLRLAIVDLSGGHQPRVDSSTGDALIFNGEIYGYSELAETLRGAGVNLIDHSDTEVLFRMLQRFGVASTLNQIDGMFSFAFYERKTGRLSLVRDRFGEKPLFYFETADSIIFGSEPRSILMHPVARSLPVDPQAVATYLAFSYLPGTQSLRRGLRKLSPGHVLTYESGKSTIERYWRPNPDQAGSALSDKSEEQRIDALDHLLNESVRKRLIADVPVGVFLSGGIDSSLIAAIVANHASNLTAFTISMADESYDEGPPAAALARHFGFKSQIIRLEDAELLTAYHVVSSKMDEPIADASLLPTYFLCRAARQNVTVALGGDGADELFAGYISFKANHAARLLAMVPRVAGRLVRELLGRYQSDEFYMSKDFLVRQLSHSFGLAPRYQWIACMAPFSPEELIEMWGRGMGTEDVNAHVERLITATLQDRGGHRWSTAELSYLFATTYLPEDILHKVDRASMYASLEVRTPFLARQFAEYSMSLPSSDKIRMMKTKRLFRKLASRYLPREIVERKKHGFAIPLGRLLRGPLKDVVGETILALNSPLYEWFRRDTIERIWSAHQSGKRDFRMKIWTLACLAIAINNTQHGFLASHGAVTAIE